MEYEGGENMSFNNRKGAVNKRIATRGAKGLMNAADKVIQSRYDKKGMLIKAVIAFLYLPGLLAFFLPVIIGIYDPWRSSFIPIGIIVILFGLTILIWCVRDFYISGRGTLAPWNPPKKLIVIGLYRFMRNPMYIGVLILVLGWSVLFSSPLLVLYLCILALSFHIRTVVYEEPYLKKRFKGEWDLYRQKVPRWFPKI